MTDLRPLALGELIDRAARLWRAHWAALFALFLPFQLAQYALLKLFAVGVRRWFPYAMGGAQAFEATRAEPVRVLRDLFSAGALSLPALACYALISAVASVAAGHFLSSQWIGPPASLSESVSRMGKRTAAILLASVLSFLWGLAALLIAALPGVAMGGGAVWLLGLQRKATLAFLAVGTLTAVAGCVVAIVWWVLRFLLVPQVLAMEELGPVKALRRSGQLISGRIGPGIGGRIQIRATLLLTASTAILWTAGFLTSLPQLLLHLAYANPFDPEHADVMAIPAALLVPAELLQVLTQAALVPLYVAICAAFYVDLRVRREGLDLERKLAA